VHSPGKCRSMPNLVPGNLAPLQVPKERLGQRLTRVGENSACKLDAILQKKFPSTLEGAVGNLIVGTISEITTSSRSVSSLPV
jgi:hypothetical protein